MKTIIFDLGGVLFDWNPRHFYKTVFSSAQEMEVFLRDICNSAWVAQQDAGRTFDEGIAIAQKQHPQYAREIALYKTGWYKMINGVFYDTVDIVKDLKAKGYPLYALTNWEAETFVWTRKTFPFLSLFEGIVVSGEEKLIKPDARLYNVLLERYNLKPEDCIYIDDNKDNVKTADELGMTTIHFTSPKDLKERLDAMLAVQLA